jgi:hypothetical protein
MDFERLTKRMNRKLGAEVLTEHGVKLMWSIADDKFSGYLSGDVLTKFKRRWILSKVKQFSELWPDKAGFGIDFYFDKEELKQVGLEDEQWLIHQLNEYLSRNGRD